MKKSLKVIIVISIMLTCISILFAVNSLNSNNNTINNNKKLSSYTSEQSNILTASKEEDITYENDKVNIYFFYGDGCQHCDKEIKILESLQEQYGEYFNLYTFEIWFNKDNLELAKKFAQSMGKELKGTPYTIIGDQAYLGFNDNYSQIFAEQIMKQHNNSYDVYFNKVSKE